MIDKLQPYGLLIGRVVIGVVFIAHGYQKWFVKGMDATTQGFEGLGIPAPQLAAYFTATVELVGGVLFILGALMPIVGFLFAFTMAGAYYYVHSATFFNQEGGYEYVLVLAAASIALGFSGGGAFAVDKLFTRKKNQDEDQAAADATTAIRTAV
ncbi:DoxX family protein [Glycomyces buryatensis]|uniref:DoxX family protein n=1 Tax=Glycomyces buryatensis TaxID=2570927 RepID=A0A4S8Q7B4_9ACTN|nr:DoxX family protein [Glycomyces buryatensis]THV38565.1 DoxX family protein [Glycomyces buryatensis]